MTAPVPPNQENAMKPPRIRLAACLAVAAVLATAPALAGPANRDRDVKVKNNTRTNVNVDSRKNTNVNVNSNRNTNVNVNTNRNVHVDVDVDRNYHPIATAAAVTATAIVVGSMVRTLPPNCTQMMVGNVMYQQCGGYWYQPQYSGSSVTYVVVNPPR